MVENENAISKYSSARNTIITEIVVEVKGAVFSWKIMWGFWQWKISHRAFNLTYRYIRLASLRQVIKSLISFQLGEEKGCAAELEEPFSGALCMVIVFQSVV